MSIPPEERRGRDAPQDAVIALPCTEPTAQAGAEAEMEAICAAYEERKRLLEEGECLAGCDCADGPLSQSGCRW